MALRDPFRALRADAADVLRTRAVAVQALADIYASGGERTAHAMAAFVPAPVELVAGPLDLDAGPVPSPATSATPYLSARLPEVRR